MTYVILCLFLLRPDGQVSHTHRIFYSLEKCQHVLANMQTKSVDGLKVQGVCQAVDGPKVGQ